MNNAIYPIVHQDFFYKDLVKSLQYSRLGFYADIAISSICCRVESREAGGKALYIMLLGVLKPYQRRGIASQLIRWAIEKAEGKEGQADDIQEMYLHMQTSNQGALSLYQSFGFTVTDEIKGYYDSTIDPPDRFVLRKPITRGASNGDSGSVPAVAAKE